MNSTGSCNCGSVKFEISSEISDVYICHCSICRKSTGSGGIAVAIVSNDDLLWLEGHDFIKTWHKPNHDWQTSFCINCGSPLPGKNDEEASYVPVSLLDSGQGRLEVKHHLFVGSKPSWENISDNGVQHKNGFSKENL